MTTFTRFDRRAACMAVAAGCAVCLTLSVPTGVSAVGNRATENTPPATRSEAQAAANQSGRNAAVRAHWSLRPIGKPAPPRVVRHEWPATPIDRFVLARLEQHQWAPSGRAPRHVLLRRAYFDLIGLPPSAADIHEFDQDDSPDAFSRVVDRLLASPHFGERWGRHWLDVVRFAESTGGGRTQVFPNAWRFRDYVIRSLNADKPFDRMIAEHIAGDLLPAANRQERTDGLIGAGFLVLGPTNYELQDKELLRMEVIDEQLDVIGRAFLGMTIGCARCHDHKFDPIPTRDYYALAGIFRSTKVLTPGNVSGYVQRDLPVDEKHRLALDRHRRKLKPLQDALAAARLSLGQVDSRPAVGPKSVAVAELAGTVVDDVNASFKGNWSRSSNVARFVGRGYRYSGSSTATARFTLPIGRSGEYEIRLAYNAHPNRAAAALATVQHSGGQSTVRINQRKPPPINGLFVSLGRYSFEKATVASVVVSNRKAKGAVIADAVQLLPVDRKRSASRPTIVARRPAGTPQSRNPNSAARQASSLRARIKLLLGQIRGLEKTAPPAPPKAMSVGEQPQVGDYHICIRGNAHKLGSQVPRGFLSAAAAPPSPRIPGGQSGRRQLAEWIASANNPLTARVFVNRVWQHLFGAGIVRSVDNFGAMGEPPSHPQLLDWLAASFVEDGWSIKPMIRRIMLSEVYRQSSTRANTGKMAAGRLANRPSAIDNRLLWRQNRRRLQAEVIRDAILSISGRLDRLMGGPTIKPGTSSEFGYKFKTRRRTVYMPVFRNNLPEVLAVFDFANPNLVAGRRTESTLPAQALYLMNSPFVTDESRTAAERLLAIAARDDGQRVHTVFRWMLGRAPSAAEQRLAQSLLRHSSESENRRKEDFRTIIQSLFCSMDFRFVD